MIMIQFDKIRRLHIELSTRCNSSCPDCPRNLRGVEIFDDVCFPLTQLSLDDIKKILPPAFINQLNIILFNGNYGDFITARDGCEIIEYLKSCKSSLEIQISTNASARPDIWETLGRLGIQVQFRLDGLKDTHHLYRQNTNWDLILSNAKKFISAGGFAVWAMIIFDHNRHQIDACRQLSMDMGFREFFLVDHLAGVRNKFPVFTRDKKLAHVVGDYQGPIDFDTIHTNYLHQQTNYASALDYVTNHSSITCKTMTIENEHRGQEIYLCANGEVYPCCWTGFYPKMNPADYTNQQLLKIIKENNALEYGLEHAVKWFTAVSESWSIPSVKQGRIMACDTVCGNDH